MTDTWCVDSHHVSVKVGDCAVHLLVKNSGKKDQNVCATVLVDGGTLSLNPNLQYMEKNAIKSITAKLAKLYNINLTYNTIVVSHWDEDHYGGLVELLRTDALAAENNKRPLHEVINYLNWKNNGVEYTPDTYLYCPNEKEEWSESGKTKRLNGLPNRFRRKGIYIEICTDNPPDSAKGNWYPFAILKSAEKSLHDVLGVNLFENKSLDSIPKDGLSPTQLIIKNKPCHNGWPGMYCVGVMNQTFRVPKSPMIVPEPVTKTNQYSIAQVILWPDGNKPPKCSHYSAGDADDRREMFYMKWLRHGGIRTITNMKLSHHGSRSSTPKSTILFHPLNIVVSNPTGTYFHPGWETIFFLSIYMRRAAETPNVLAPQIFATKYPFYFSVDEKGHFVNIGDVDERKPLLSTKAFDDRKHGKILQEFIETSYREFQTWSGTNEIIAYQTKISKQDKRNEIMKLLVSRWKEYCWPPADFYDNADGATIKPKVKKTTSRAAPESLMVRSSPDNAEDGKVGYTRFGLNELFMHNRLQTTRASTSTDILSKRAGPLNLNGDNSGKKMRTNNSNMPIKLFPWNSKLSTGVLDGYKEEDVDNDLVTQPISKEGAFYSKGGTNENEMDHEDWRVNGSDDTNSTTLDGISRSLQSSQHRENEHTTAAKAGGGIFDPPTDAWYIYASLYLSTIGDASIGAATERYTRIDKESPWDGFVATLHCAVLALAIDPLRGGVDTKSIELLPDDELRCWFHDALGATNVMVLKNTDALAAGIGGFALTVPVKVAPSADSPETSTPLLFTTDSAALEIAFSDSEPPNMGLRDGATAILFALSAKAGLADTNLRLDSLATFVGLGSIFVENPLLSVLSSLLFTVPDPNNPGKGHRNAVWFVPQSAYATTMRLQLDLAPGHHKDLQSFLGLLECTIKSAYVIARRKHMWTSSNKSVFIRSQGELVLVTEMTIEGLDFKGIIELTSRGVVIELILNTKTGNVLDKMEKWLKRIIKEKYRCNREDPFAFRKWLSQEAGHISFPSFDFRRLTLSFVSTHDNTSSLSFSSLAMDMELRFKAKDQVVLSLITFNYSAAGGASSSLEADLWLAPPYNVNDPALKLLPDFENYGWFEPLGLDSTKFWSSYLELDKLAGFMSEDSPPRIFPKAITMAKLYVNKEAVGVTGTLRAITSQTHSKPPIFSIYQIDMAASHKFSTGTSLGTMDIALGVTALIQPPPGAEIQPAELKGGFHFDESNKSWHLKATINSLSVAHLYQFFHSDVQLSATSLLGNLSIKEFVVQYFYQRGEANEFELKGTMSIKNIELSLIYTNKGDSWNWDFYAHIEFKNDKDQQLTTYGDILKDIIGNDVQLPGFLKDIKVSLQSSGDRVGIRLTPNKEKECTVFTMFVQLGFLRIQYIQYAYSKPGVSQKDKPPIKRVFLTSIQQFESVEVPLLGKLSQPFDGAIAMWVQPQTGSVGLTKGEVTLINDIITKVPISQKPLPFKAPKTTPGDADVVLKNGVHLMITLKDNQGNVNVALDYVLGGGSGKPTSALLAREQDTDSGMTRYSKSYGGLSVRNLGLKYVSGESTLTVKVDATVKFGPMEFALSGFALSLKFVPDEGFSLFNLPKPSVKLDGLAAVYDKPPITVGGMLEHVDETMYQGALVASFKPWEFSAAGCYGEIPGLEEYKTFFVYARFLGPLITFEFATISGVTAGFGYNSRMRMPTVNSIMTYPLISNPEPPTSDPQGVMRKLTENKEWFLPQHGSFWIAAGLEVTAFEMLVVSAVLAIEWGHGLKIGVFALATTDIPAKVSGKYAFAHVQLGLTAIIDVGAGTMKIDGQVTPSSYILHPDCHLTGGFAFYTWFGDSVPKLKGDWVFTLGGYHRQYKRPVQYPNPPRLGISWQFSEAISIRGEAYFAITPKVCMGGGRWDVSLSLGPLQAYYYAFVDFLINFAPFHFKAEGSIAVGVRFTMDMWLVTVHISVDIGATIRIEGPPIHGMVHVDFWVFGFDINFGSDGDKAVKLSLDDFITLACQASSDQGPSSLFHSIQADTPVGSPMPHTRTTHGDRESAVPDRQHHVLVVQSGLIPDQQIESRPSGGPWTVRAATFSFSVSCKVAISRATIITGRPSGTGVKEEEDETTFPVEGTGNPIYARPMCTGNELKTELKIRITPVPPSHKQLKSTKEYGDEGDPIWNKNKAIVKNLPVGLWGKYDPNKDPSYHTNDVEYLNGQKEATVSLLCGVVISVPDATPSKLDKTFPFNYERFMVQRIDYKLFPELPQNSKNFQPADPGDKKKQWDRVRRGWKDPKLGESAPTQSVTIWECVGLSALGWDPAKVDNDAGENLTGEKPQRLIDGLEDYYLWAPFITA